MDKIQRATEIHRAMTPHQMALRIVELEDDSAAAIEAMNAAREAISETSAKFAEYNAKLDSYDKRITELQDALDLAEEAVRAKQQAVPEGWQLVPVEPTTDMMDAGEDTFIPTYTGTPVSCQIDVYRAMLAAAPKYEGCAE